MLLLLACTNPRDPIHPADDTGGSACPVENEGFTPIGFPVDTADGDDDRQVHGPVALADLDGDGDDDLLVGHRHEGVFLSLAEAGEFGTASLVSDVDYASSFGVGDVDGDGDLDVLVVSTDGAGALLRNDGAGNLVVDAGTPIFATAARNVSLGDLEGDGDLDLYVTGGGEPDHLYANDAGSFADVSERLVGTDGLGWMTVWLDVDDDGDPDLYTVNAEQSSMGPSRLLLNDGTGHFVDASEACGCDFQGSPMGASVGDVDADGRPDLLLTNNGPTSLIQNLGGGQFVEVAAARGIATKSGDFSMSFGAAWWDADLDGDEDALLAFGPLRGASEKGRQPEEQPDLFFRNDGDTFVEIAAELGLDDPAPGRGVATGLVDGDGGLDVVVSNVDAVSNAWIGPCTGGGALVVDLRRPAADRFGLGARVEVTLSDGTRLTRWVTGQAGWGGAVHPRAHFGLGDRRAESVRVRWPWGAGETEVEVPRGEWRIVVEE